ncbi:MAG: hypothetical protein N3A72_04405 [bacterium]|nr:hypothetical protein [bacterium]
MPKKLKPKDRELGVEFAELWRKISECMAKALHEPTFDPRWEDEYLKLAMRSAEIIVPVSNKLGLEPGFVDKVISFLEEVFALRYLKELQEFQITLLRDRWSAVNLELNRVLGLEVTRFK